MQIVLWLLLSVPFVSLKAQQSLWVGEEYQCFLTDYANTSLSIVNVSWTVPSEMKEEFSGTYVRTVSFSQYQSGTYSVRASWKETDLSDSFSPFYSKSHTWSFTCRDNPLVLNNSSLTLTKGSTGTIGYSHTYSNEYTSLAKVTYSSSNSSIASVSSTGVVTAKGTGTATITVTSTIAKDPKTCTVTVKATPGIQFADAEVKELCVANWDTDGDGELSKAEAAAVTDLGEVFRKNTEITEFEELEYFTGLTSIGEWAFYSCSSLTSVTIPNSVTIIEDIAFARSGLTSITIPESVTSIENQAFSDCSNLTSISIPNGVTSIGHYAFSDCDALTSIIIPSSVTFIGTGLDYNVTYSFAGISLTSIVVEPGNPKYDSRDNCNAIIETESNTLIAGCKGTIIPKSVTSIGFCAFCHCEGLTSVTIPESVTSIGNSAFKSCSGLTSVTIPESVTSICSDAFNYCI